MRLRQVLSCVAVVASFAASPITARAAQTPFIVSQEYRERLVAGNAREMPAACRVAFAEVEDGRRDRTMLGNVARRQVRSPPDTIAWIRSVLSGLRHRGIDVLFEGAPPADANALSADVRLLVAWVTSIRTNKSANAAIRFRLRRGDEIVFERDYRGAETTMNWASGDRELQKVIDTAFGRLLDAVAPDLLAVCGT
jgi:hypothetical protein